MSWEENKEYTESKPNYQPDPPEPFSLLKKTRWYIVVGVVCFLFGLSCNACRSNEIVKTNRDLVQSNQKLRKELENAAAETVIVTVPVNVTESNPAAKATAPATKDAAPVTDVPAAESTESSYEHNNFYDIVETSIIKDNLGHYTTVVHKVLAKKDGTASADLIAYGADGNVIDKDSEMIILTEGQYNFFQYVFSNDISDASIQAKVQTKTCSFSSEERNGVEMVSYNQNGDDLYITFKQNIDDISFARFKLLFYKDDKIIDTEDGVFKIRSDYMNGKGDTDVIEISLYNTDYDRFEYIYQPDLF